MSAPNRAAVPPAAVPAAAAVATNRTTRVVNLRREPYDVYIGRPGQGQAGPWGNPFRLNAESQRGPVLERYRSWLQSQIAAGRISKPALAELHGKTLGCFCKPKACHGDVLAAAADQAWAELHDPANQLPPTPSPTAAPASSPTAAAPDRPNPAPEPAAKQFAPETKKQSISHAPFSLNETAPPRQPAAAAAGTAAPRRPANPNAAAAGRPNPHPNPPGGQLIFRPGADLFAQDAAYLVNTVNCVGVMGAGIALAVKQRWPACYHAYRAACRPGQLRPGQLHLWRNPLASRPGQTQGIINFPTKDDWRQPSRLEWIDQGLQALVELARQERFPSLALPPLGCGRGGLDWQQVKPLLLRHLQPLAAEGMTIIVCAPPPGR